MARLAVFIDGGYVEALRRNEFREFTLRADMQKLSERIRQSVADATPEPVDLFRSYYYTCPPYQHEPPTDEDRSRTAGYRSFVKALTHLPRFQVREGRLRHDGFREDGRPIFIQKRVDLLLGLDAALLAGRQLVTHIALVAGDGDFVPAAEAVKGEGVSVWLFHGPRYGADHRSTYAYDLWLAADERHEMDKAFMRDIARNPS